MSKPTMSAARWIYLKHQWEMSQAEIAAVEEYAAYTRQEAESEIAQLKEAVNLERTIGAGMMVERDAALTRVERLREALNGSPELLEFAAKELRRAGWDVDANDALDIANEQRAALADASATAGGAEVKP